MLTVFNQNDADITPPSGWTEARLDDSKTTAFVFYYILNAGSRSGAETWALAGSNVWTVSLAEYSGMGANATLDSLSFADSNASFLSNYTGVEAVTGAEHTLAVLMTGYGTNTTVSFTRTSVDGPFSYTEVADVIRNVSVHNRHVHAYKFFTDYALPSEAMRLRNSTGGAGAYVAIQCVFRDTVAATPPSSGAAGGASAEVQRDASAADTGVGGNTLTLTLPANPTAGNLQVICVAAGKNADFTGILTPAGWTLADEAGGVTVFLPTSGYGRRGMKLFYKTSAGASDKEVVVDFQESILRVGWMVEISGSTTTLGAVVPASAAVTLPIISIGNQVALATDEGFSVGLTPEVGEGMWVAFIACEYDLTSTSDLDGGFSFVARTAGAFGLSLHYFKKAASGIGRGRIVINPSVAPNSGYMGILACFGVQPASPGFVPYQIPLRMRAHVLPYAVRKME
jgi:hypothetical protein